MQVVASELARPDDITKRRIMSNKNSFFVFLVNGYCNCSGNFADLAMNS